VTTDLLLLGRNAAISCSLVAQSFAILFHEYIVPNLLIFTSSHLSSFTPSSTFHRICCHVFVVNKSCPFVNFVVLSHAISASELANAAELSTWPNVIDSGAEKSQLLIAVTIFFFFSFISLIFCVSSIVFQIAAFTALSFHIVSLKSHSTDSQNAAAQSALLLSIFCSN
jgi:hypothetical protein